MTSRGRKILELAMTKDVMESKTNSEASSELNNEQQEAICMIESYLESDDQMEPECSTEVEEAGVCSKGLSSNLNDTKVSNEFDSDNSDIDRDYVPETDETSSDDDKFHSQRKEREREQLKKSPCKKQKLSTFGNGVSGTSYQSELQHHTESDYSSESENCDVNVIKTSSQLKRKRSEISLRHHSIENNDLSVRNYKRNKNGVHSRKNKMDRKIKRNTGKEYFTTAGKLVRARESKPLLPCRMKCKDILETISGGKTIREEIFNAYWALGNHDKRVSYVASLVDSVEPSASRKRTDDLAKEKFRMVTHFFHFQIHGKRVRVCRRCFTRTLDETPMFITLAISNRSANISGTTDSDNRGKRIPANKHSNDKINEVIQHINSFPIYKSHYTRRESTRRYLPAFLNLSTMYSLYTEGRDNPVSRNVYEIEFHKLNISFKEPKVDTCHRCDVFHTKISLENDFDQRKELEEELVKHHTEADEAYLSKDKDKNFAKLNESTKCFMFDLQQCLPTPHLNTSIAFYKRQLWTFNLTIHEASSGKVRCYMWHEGEGGRGGNQIATCIYKELMSLPPAVKFVTMYSDTCGGQNRNSHVAMMFLKVMQDNVNLERIDHKFMVSGHSHLECDVDHAMIEKQKKKLQLPVYIPHDWFQLVRCTGKKGKKFEVIELTHNDFIQFSSLLKEPFTLRKKNTDGDIFSWQKSRWFRYTKEYGKLYYKDNLNEESPFKEVSFLRRGNQEKTELQPKKCYTDTIPISKEKMKDLMDLMELIPPSMHSFYKNLKSSTSVPCTLPDIEEFID